MRRPSLTVAARNAELVRRIHALKADHPFWGYRRVWASLRFGERRDVNKKRILRLMRCHGLLVTPDTKLRARRVSQHTKPRPVRPRQWWGIDMTKVMTERGWAYVVIVLDWYTKQIVGHHAGSVATSREWLSALERALMCQFPDGSRQHALHLMSDNGCQPTSVRFMKACGVLGVQQAFTSYNNPKGNADTERMMRTMKEELFWLREWTGPEEVSPALSAWVVDYNLSYRHSALGYRTPDSAACDGGVTRHRREECGKPSHRTLLLTA